MQTQPRAVSARFDQRVARIVIELDVRLDQDTVWLTQRQMAELFDTTPQNVVTHLGNVFADNELDEPATSKDFLIVQIEGRRRIRRPVKHYNLDAIISVGYRVNSRRGVGFRQWATATLREHLVRGYTLNRQRFEDNARELESALVLVRKAASGEALTTDQGDPERGCNDRGFLGSSFRGPIPSRTHRDRVPSARR